MNKILLIIVILIVVLGTFILLGNKKTNPAITEPTAKPAITKPSNPIITITLTDSGFTPKDITVKGETRVAWINKSGTVATVNSDDHPTHQLYRFLNLGEFADGSSVQVVFDKAGKYSYHNHLNASETGTVTVE